MLCPVGALDVISNKIGSKLGFTKRMDILPCKECEIACPNNAICYGSYRNRHPEPVAVHGLKIAIQTDAETSSA
ncbi:MAG: hypothetical protein AB1348_09040 [Nitrospirota bacterium]